MNRLHLQGENLPLYLYMSWLQYLQIYLQYNLCNLAHLMQHIFQQRNLCMWQCQHLRHAFQEHMQNMWMRLRMKFGRLGN